MIIVSYKEGKELALDNVCGNCGAELVLSWGGNWDINSYVLKCARGINHQEIARPARLGAYDIPGFNLFNLNKGREIMEQEFGPEKTEALAKYHGVVSLTKVQAIEILKTIWPGAPEVEVIKAAMVSQQYGLNPLMKHVFLLKFKKWNKDHTRVIGENWATVLGIKANRLIAHRCGDFSYLDLTPRVMTEEEQKSIFGEVEPTKIWAITKLKDNRGNEAPGYGSWPRGEAPYGAEKGNTKANMAFIRSERNALDRLFAGEMPQGVEVIDEEYASDGSIEQVGRGGVDLLDEKRESETEGKLGGHDDPHHHPAESGKAKKAGTANFREAKTSPKKTEVSAAGAEHSAEPFGSTVAGIDTTWLDDTLNELSWSNDTVISFLGRYKVSLEGTALDVLLRLTQEQINDFVQQLQSRLSKKQRLL